MSADKEILKLMIEKAESKLEMANIALTNDQYDEEVTTQYSMQFRLYFLQKVYLFLLILKQSVHLIKNLLGLISFQNIIQKKFKLSSMKDKQEIMIFVRTLMR